MKMRFRTCECLCTNYCFDNFVWIKLSYIIIIGKDPYETFKIMFEYGIRGKSIVSIINRSIPLYISAMQLLLVSKWDYLISVLKVSI